MAQAKKSVKKKAEPRKKAQTAHEKKTAAQKTLMIEALERNLGIVTAACKATGIGRRTVYNWMESDEDFRRDVEAIGDIAVDFAESELIKKMKGGDTTAIIFFLKCKGKKRGYVEKQEIAVTENNFTPDAAKLAEAADRVMDRMAERGLL